MEEKFKHSVTDDQKSIRSAIKQLNESNLQILIVVDPEDRLLGTVTDGDIRRAIINGVSLDESIAKIMNRSPKYVHVNEENKAYELMAKYKIRSIPVVEDEKVIDLISVQDFLDAKIRKRKPNAKSNYIVIMAGGKGTRLDPFTKVLPKPLIPIGDKPMLELVMGNFKKYGFNNFIISLNYKAEIIKLYFAENPDGYDINFIQEHESLGTAGALSLAADKINETFIVSNCDVIVDIDFSDLISYHKHQKNSATIVGVIRNMQIPYGVLDVRDGHLIKMTEKPEFDFVINSGVYVLEPELINLIKENEFVNMPDLLWKAKELNYKIGVFPISSNWFDVGQWEEYQRTLDYFKKIDGTYNT